MASPRIISQRLNWGSERECSRARTACRPVLARVLFFLTEVVAEIQAGGGTDDQDAKRRKCPTVTAISSLRTTRMCGKRRPLCSADQLKFENDFIYCHSLPGMKIEGLRKHP